MTIRAGSQAAYAKHKDVSKQTVTDWKKRGLLVFNESGDVDFVATDEALAAHNIRQVAPVEAAAVYADDIDVALAELLQDGEQLWSKAQAETVKENYAARIKRLEYDRESAAVAEIDDVVVAIASEYALVRNRLLNIGSKVAPRIAAMWDAGEIKDLIDKEVIASLNELTIDDAGERDFDKLRTSIQGRLKQTD